MVEDGGAVRQGASVGAGAGVLSRLGQRGGVSVATGPGEVPSDDGVQVVKGSVPPRNDVATVGSGPAIETSRVPHPVRSSSATVSIPISQHRDSAIWSSRSGPELHPGSSIPAMCSPCCRRSAFRAALLASSAPD
jgi:hypothetical protein